MAGMSLLEDNLQVSSVIDHPLLPFSAHSSLLFILMVLGLDGQGWYKSLSVLRWG